MNTPPLSDYAIPALKTTGKRKRSPLSSTPEPSLYNLNVMQNAVIKKQKACLNCRRSKLKCVVDEERGGACVRCITRNEECRFKSRSHDDEWQETTSNRLDMLTQAVEQLSYSMDMVMQHLNLNPLQVVSHSVNPQAQSQSQCAPIHHPQARIPAPSYLPIPEQAQLMRPWPSPPTSLDERFSSPSLSPDIMPIPNKTAFANNSEIFEDYFSALPPSQGPSPNRLTYPAPTGNVLGVYSESSPFDDLPCAPPMNYPMSHVPQHFVGVNGSTTMRHQ